MYKICFVSTVPGTMRGFILPLANYIHDNYKDEFDISIMCSPIEDFENMVPEYIHFIPVMMQRGIDFNGLSIINTMKHIFKDNKFDLVQYSTPNASLYASIAAKRAKIPVRLYCQWGLVFEGFRGLKRKLFIAIEKIVCRKSTHIEPDSNGNLLLCRKFGFYDECKSSVVLYGSAKGVDLTVFDINERERFRKEIREKYSISNDAFVFGFVGSITGDKGINELLYAFRDINSVYPNTVLMLVGDTEKEYSLIDDLLEWAQKTTSIVFTGHSTDVPKKMSAMDCYVCPSYREGFGTTVIEAGAMGLPVITSDIPGPTDVIKDGVNGLVFENKNIEALKEAMISMYSNEELRKQFGDNGLQLVRERYDQKVVFEAIVNDRKKLLESK